ncbi:PET100 [Candida metapsilosis]|uniref:PET100 n=1 Tax=Candida metapsilosis TaxID=273372 RepID=A0A8H7ZIC5_9ASCO|nr:PET100 [Candida metapsilosis]
MSYIRRFINNVTRTQLETAKFGFYLLSPILIMYYVGLDTDKKFNLPGFWPDPATLNQIPKEPYEIQAEVARIRKARAEKRARLEAKARELGITEDDVEEEK